MGVEEKNKNIKLGRKHHAELVDGRLISSGSSQLYTQYFQAGDRIKNLVNEETNFNSSFPSHQLVPWGIVSYVTAIEAYINHYPCLWLSLPVEGLTQAQTDKIYKLVNENLSDKVRSVWSVFNLEKPDGLDLSEVNALIEMRGEIIHYAPFFHGVGQFRKRVLSAVQLAGLDPKFNTNWAYFLFSPKLLDWASKISESYIRSLSDAGYGIDKVLLTKKDMEDFFKKSE